MSQLPALLCAQNRNRTCTPRGTRTWNARVYHSATWARKKKNEPWCVKHLEPRFERKTRLELATPTLARLCSTNWAISAWHRVKRRRLELPRLAALPPQSSASTNSATSPYKCFFSKFCFPFGLPWIAIPPNCECKGTAFFETCKTFWHFFLHFFIFLAFHRSHLSGTVCSYILYLCAYARGKCFQSLHRLFLMCTKKVKMCIIGQNNASKYCTIAQNVVTLQREKDNKKHLLITKT